MHKAFSDMLNVMSLMFLCLPDVKRRDTILSYCAGLGLIMLHSVEEMVEKIPEEELGDLRKAAADGRLHEYF